MMEISVCETMLMPLSFEDLNDPSQIAEIRQKWMGPQKMMELEMAKAASLPSWESQLIRACCPGGGPAMLAEKASNR